MYCISRLRFSDIGGMAEVDEQRVYIKFCVRLGKTGSETFEMLKQAFGDSCMSHIRVKRKGNHVQDRTDPEAPTVSRKSAYEAAKIVSPTHRPSLLAGDQTHDPTAVSQCHNQLRHRVLLYLKVILRN